MSILPLNNLNSYQPTTGQIYYDSSSGMKYVIDGSGNPLLIQSEPTVVELEAREKYKLDVELRAAEHREKLEALKTIFPRGYKAIDNFDVMVDIAREDQLNPLYEQTLREFEDAQTALHRAANKLASAVKLTDLDEITARTKTYADSLRNVNTAYASSGIYNSYSNSFTATQTMALSGTVGIPGPTGAMGMTGPQGIKGDTGAQGLKGDKGDTGASALESMGHWFKGLFK